MGHARQRAAAEPRGGPSWTVFPAGALGTGAAQELVAADGWIRSVIGAHHPRLGRLVCPFVPPALERGSAYYAEVRGCRCAEDVVTAMGELVERFVALPPLTGADAQLKTLVAIFAELAGDPARAIADAHRELKDRCVDRGLMVGEFAPGYYLASTRDATVNVGDAPVPALAVRYMLASDRRFLQEQDRWMAAWATRFGADRVALFRDFSEEELAAVARVARERTVAAGETLCQHGDVGHELFLIVEGEAVVRRSGREVARLGPRDYFGELAVLTREHRNATVVAASEMTLLVLGRAQFKEAMDASPTLAQTLVASLAMRLSKAYAESVQGPL